MSKSKFNPKKSNSKDGGSKRNDNKHAEHAVPKSSATETAATPTLCVLQLRPKSNYCDWEKSNALYFSRTYGKYGEFFETKERIQAYDPNKTGCAHPWRRKQSRYLVHCNSSPRDSSNQKRRTIQDYCCTGRWSSGS